MKFPISKINFSELRDRIFAMFILSAIGDGLAAPMETMKRDEIKKKFGYVRDYVSGKGHKWYDKFELGQWTDDTQLFLAIARSFARLKIIDPVDIYFEHFVEFIKSAVGWGRSTRESMEKIDKAFYEDGIELDFAGSPNGFGNSVAMKIAPMGAILAVRIKEIIESKQVDLQKKWDALIDEISDFVEKIARMTHYTRMGVASGLAQAFAVATCLLGYDDQDLFREIFLEAILEGAKRGENNQRIESLDKHRLSTRFRALNGIRVWDDFDVKIALDFSDGATCYAYNSLPFTYAMFLREPKSIETLFEVVNAGGDTDSNGAMVGALLGAYNGTKIIPKYLWDGLWHKEEVEKTANAFCDALGL